MSELIDTRVVYGIGNGVANIYGLDGGTFRVEVVSNNGREFKDVADHDEAWRTWLHPFAHGIEIPAAQATDKPWSPVERALYLGIELAEAGDSDVA